MLEGMLIFSRQQALTGTSDVNSTDVYDHGSAVKLFGGWGNPFLLQIVISASGGTNPTYRGRLVGADSADMSSNPIVIVDTGVSAVLAAGDIPKLYELLLGGQLVAKRYYRVIHLQGGTDPTATVNAHCAPAHQNRHIR